MDDRHSIKEGLLANSSPVTYLLVAIIAVALLVQLLVAIFNIVRSIIEIHITLLKIFVIWPVWILIRILFVSLKLIRLSILVLIWAVYSLALGIMALFTLFGLLYRRHEQAEPSNSGGDSNPVETSRQEADVTSTRAIGLEGCVGDWRQVHILLSDGTDGSAGAWQATPLRRYGWETQGSLAPRQIQVTSPPLRNNRVVHGAVVGAKGSPVQWGSRGNFEEVFGEHSDII